VSLLLFFEVLELEQLIKKAEKFPTHRASEETRLIYNVKLCNPLVRNNVE
jgi:hypothetical protein